MKYLLRMNKTYIEKESTDHKIEADSEEEAIEMLKANHGEGLIKGSEYCYKRDAHEGMSEEIELIEYLTMSEKKKEG